MNLTGRTILITGGSAGIGLAFAKKFVDLGNQVIITGRNQAKLDAAKAVLPGIATIQADASKAGDIQRLAATIASDHPALDVLINNAGIFVYRNLSAPADDLTELTKEIDVNLAGPIRTISALVDILKANNGTIINVSSGLAFVPFQAAPVYSATKAALHAYTTVLRQQLAGKVEVVELMPPLVKTDMTAGFDGADDFGIVTTDVLVNATIAGLKAGHQEIRPGLANRLHWMSRIAPGFINGQLAKGAAEFIPEV